MSYQNSYNLLMTYKCMLFHLHRNPFYNDSQSFQPHLCTKPLLNNCEHLYPGIHRYLVDIISVTENYYCIAGNFRGTQFSRIDNLLTLILFHSSIFVDARNRAITCMYKCADFVDLIYMHGLLINSKNRKN